MNGSTSDRRVRDSALLLPDEPLCCPRGHRVPKHFFINGEDQNGGYRCQFREPPTKHVCDAGVFLLQFVPGMRVVTDVSPAELHEMERRRMDLRQVRDYLGLFWRKEAA